MADKNRLMPLTCFAELCGYTPSYIEKIFRYKVSPITDIVQIRVSKTLQSWERGELKVMRKFDGKLFVEYRKVPQPRLVKKLTLTIEGKAIKLRPRLMNRSDYGAVTLEDQLREYE